MSSHAQLPGRSLALVHQCLRDYLQLVPPQQQPGLPTLDIRCFCPTRANAIATRVEQLFQDIAACYYSGTRPVATRYVLEMQREFYVHWQLAGRAAVAFSARPLCWRVLGISSGRVQRKYSPHCRGSQLPAWLAKLSHYRQIGACGLHQGDLSAPRKQFLMPRQMSSCSTKWARCTTSPHRFATNKPCCSRCINSCSPRYFARAAKTAELCRRARTMSCWKPVYPRSIEYYEVAESSQAPVQIERRTVRTATGQSIFECAGTRRLRFLTAI